jgi:hypothetical protein
MASLNEDRNGDSTTGLPKTTRGADTRTPAQGLPRTGTGTMRTTRGLGLGQLKKPPKGLRGDARMGTEMGPPHKDEDKGGDESTQGWKQSAPHKDGMGPSCEGEDGAKDGDRDKTNA